MVLTWVDTEATEQTEALYKYIDANAYETTNVTEDGTIVRRYDFNDGDLTINYNNTLLTCSYAKTQYMVSTGFYIKINSNSLGANMLFINDDYRTTLSFD